MAKKTFNRRKFIIRSGIGLGVLFGVGLLGRGPLRRMLAQTAEETILPFDNKFDAYIWFEIKPDNQIILRSPKVEMGQGIFTALAQIAAEELEVDWEKITVVHANTAQGPIDFVSTGGSLSITGLYEPLRALAATMREMLKVNAAELMGVSVNALSVKNGEIVGGGKTMSYGEVAEKASNWDFKIDPPTLKSKSQFKFIGKALPRIDLVAKVKGEPIFGIDGSFPEMLYGSVLRPPVVGAKFISATPGKAAQMPGVIKVVIEKDFIGVVAESRVQAEDAKHQVDVKWQMPEKLLQQADVDALIKVGAGNDVVIQTEGSVALTGENVFSREYFTPMGAHGHIEPNGASAHYQNGKVTVKLSTQVANLTRKEVAKALNIKEEDVDVQPQYLGGGFGRRLETPHAVEAALLSKAVGKPVHVFFERTEEFQNGILRPPSHNVLKAKLNKDGNIESIEHHTASSDVAFDSSLLSVFLNPMSNDVAKAVVGADFGAWRGGMIQYKAIPNYKTVAWHAELPFKTSWWRGLGLLSNTFAIESFMDELAHETKQDPLAFRLKHLADNEKGKLLKSVLKAAAQHAEWDKPLPAGKARGIACSIDVGTPVAQIAEVEIKDGKIKVNKVICAIDPGLIINPDGVKAQTEGAIIMGMSASMFEEITIKDGKMQPNTFGYYQMAFIRDAPEIDVVLLSSGENPRGMGEPPIGPIGAAIANAVFQLTGKRLNRIPLNLEG